MTVARPPFALSSLVGFRIFFFAYRSSTSLLHYHLDTIPISKGRNSSPLLSSLRAWPSLTSCDVRSPNAHLLHSSLPLFLPSLSSAMKPATPGTILTAASTVLLALASFSTPLIKSLYFFKATLSSTAISGELTLGTLGFCLVKDGTTTCSSPSVGYDLGT